MEKGYQATRIRYLDQQILEVNNVMNQKTQSERSSQERRCLTSCVEAEQIHHSPIRLKLMTPGY